jgi:DNA topoisomerase III
MAERWLCVAEKPDAARKIAAILSNNSATSTQGASRYNWNHLFPTTVRGQQVAMTVTSITGHLYNYDFSQEYGWYSCDPSVLFDLSVPVHKIVGKVRAFFFCFKASP